MKTKFFSFLLSIFFLNSTIPLFSQKPIAVLIVGYQEETTASSIDQADDIASLLLKNNFKIHKFYDEDANWESIKKILPEASIVLYDGHGTHLGLDGEFGGLAISNFISGQKIVDDIHFTHKPLILFQSVCGGAGGSAGDDDDIGFQEAMNRSHDSFLPFYLAGAAGYIANNYVGGIYKNLLELFDGKSLEDSFGPHTLWTDKEETKLGFEKHPTYLHKTYSSKGGGIATRTTYINGKKHVTKITSPRDYDICFIGDPNFTIEILLSEALSKN